MKTEVKALIGTLRAEKQRIEVAILALSGVLGNDIMDPVAPPKVKRAKVTRQRFAPELKARIVREYEEGNDALHVVASRHGVSAGTAANWVAGRALGKSNGSIAVPVTHSNERELVGA